jgi:hypothetical protein
MNDTERPGFRMGEYFITFPDDEFVKEDADGRMYVLTDIYKIGKNNTTAKRVSQEEITPELEEMINIEINRLLTDGLNLMEDSKKENGE